jgi:hypothetical protein
MPDFLKNPVVFIAATIGGLQFVTNTVTDVVFGGILVALIAFTSKK